MRTAGTVALVLGDHLTVANSALRGIDPARDTVLMIEAPGEATNVWSHKARIAFFLAAMRHFRDRLLEQGFRVHYVSLDDNAPDSFADRLRRALAAVRPSVVRVCEPGEYRMLQLVQDVVAGQGIPLDVTPDEHFMIGRSGFAAWAGSRRQLVMENFYRHMRNHFGVLMTGDSPAGGEWNYDAMNRKSFGARGPGLVPQPCTSTPDEVTKAVLRAVARRFPGHPGSLEHFAWPVTRDAALTALRDFIEHRLPSFGEHQDAMWSGEPFLWHSLLSAALNLKLLDPREVIGAAVEAWREGHAPIAAVEGFVRQIIGWREFIRGVYWLDMPRLAAANHFRCESPLPSWYWTADTGMACMRAAIGQTLEHGYAHHIQRLMITGNFAMLAGLKPAQVADWYEAVYVDAVEWVQLPNTLGMALHAAGPRFTTKPYAASGAYVNRMSNYCKGCRYDPKMKTGPKACPMTVLYWSFVIRHQAMLAVNPRTALMAKNAERIGKDERDELTRTSESMLERLDTV